MRANLHTVNDEISTIYNIGTAIETNVNEVFSKLNNLAGGIAEEKHGPAAKGEQLRSVISSQKIFNKFNWRPSVKIDEGLKITFDYFKSKL